MRSNDASDVDGTILASEFAAVRVTVDRKALGPRLLLEDLDSGHQIYLEPLELASFCLATEADRIRWLRVGAYRPAARASDHQQGESSA